MRAPRELKSVSGLSSRVRMRRLFRTTPDVVPKRVENMRPPYSPIGKSVIAGASPPPGAFAAPPRSASSVALYTRAPLLQPEGRAGPPVRVRVAASRHVGVPVRGPASTPQPGYQNRVLADKLELRRCEKRAIRQRAI